MMNDSWEEYKSFIIFKHPGFQFKSETLITSLESIFISAKKRPTFTDPVVFVEEILKIKSAPFLNKLLTLSKDYSVILLSNHTIGGALNHFIIKKKIEFLVEKGLHMLAITGIKRNFLMKPHTGLWKLARLFYKKHASATIYKPCFISYYGGIGYKKAGEKLAPVNFSDPTTTQKNNKIDIFYNDTDRCFAENCQIPFITVDEFLDSKLEQQSFMTKPRYNPTEWLKENKASSRIDLETVIEKAKAAADLLVIFIIGPPRCGKTTLAKHIQTIWKSNKVLSESALQFITSEKQGAKIREFTKAINNRINIIIDDKVYSEEQRRPFLERIATKKSAILYIEIDLPQEIIKLMNEISVELSTNESHEIAKEELYIEYIGKYKKPKIRDPTTQAYIPYQPLIEPSREWFMKY
jgi:adenylate kinase family enzyme